MVGLGKIELREQQSLSKLETQKDGMMDKTELTTINEAKKQYNKSLLDLASNGRGTAV